MANNTGIGPSDISSEDARQMEKLLSGSVRPCLVSKAGDVVEIPEALSNILVAALELAARGQRAVLVSENETFTTQAAANFLGISRQYFVGLLERGEIPFHLVGTHRRVTFKDLDAYRSRRSQKRAGILDQMAKELADAGLDDDYVDLTRSESA